MTTKGFEDLVERFRPELLAYAERYSRELGPRVCPDDLVQATLLRLWQYHDTHSTASFDELRNVALRAMRTAMFDAFRASRRVRRGGDPRWFAEDLPAGAARDETLAAMLSSISALPSRYREIVQASFFHGQSFEAIAKASGISVNAARKRLARALGAVRASLTRKSSQSSVEHASEHLESRPLEFRDSTSPPAFIIVWDPATVTEREYAVIASALGDLVRAEGALGIERIRSQGYGVQVPAGSLV